MGKIRVVICLISARGLRRSSSLWKLQWFAVGWIDPKNKYVTKIDASGSTNPTWRTKFSALIDDSESKLQGLALHVEVYSRDSIFLREKLQGTAVVVLKEFLDKYINMKKSEASKAGVEQVGSFQLRKKNSGKAHGLVDVSIRVSDEEGSSDYQEISSYPGNGEGFQLTGEGNGISLGTGNGPYSSQSYQVPLDHTGIYPQPQMTSAYGPQPNYYANLSSGSGPSYHPPRTPPLDHTGIYPQPQMTSAYGPQPNYYMNPSSGGGPSYRPPLTPPPPPPPSHVGYLPTFLPSTGQPPGTFMNIPSSSSAGAAAGRSGFGIGMGAGALAAGAVIFGDDFMSGFELPSTLQDGDLIISTDSPF